MAYNCPQLPQADQSLCRASRFGFPYRRLPSEEKDGLLSARDNRQSAGRLFALTLINWEFIFDLNCKLSANDKKSRYTAHQISGRKSLAIALMKLCTGSEIQKPSMSAFSVPQADTATGTAQPQFLSAAALCFTQIFNCGSLMRAHRLYHVEHLFVKRI